MAGLTNRSFAIGTDSALAIVNLGTNAAPAIPILLNDLQNPNHFYRERAADALGNLHIQPDVVVPALTNLLNDPTNAARFIAINSLGKFGPAARSAVPVIAPFLTNSDLDVVAKRALRQIAPEVLTNAPRR
jgi:HEAT repeat protein